MSNDEALQQLIEQQRLETEANNQAFRATQERMAAETSDARALLVQKRKSLTPELQTLVATLQENPVLVQPTLDWIKQKLEAIKEAIQKELAA